MNLLYLNGQLVSRDPLCAFFFWLSRGEIYCTYISTTSGKALCGTALAKIHNGQVQVQGTVQVKVSCKWDPGFIVAVRVGSAQVIDPAGKDYRIKSGFQLSCNFRTRLSTVTPVVFSARDCAVFIGQARVKKLPRLPQAITFISKPPLSAVKGDKYIVTVAASSGNPVQLSIASSSTSVCSISSYTVTFNYIQCAGLVRH